LLTAAQRDRVDVVLVSPRNPLNIGAVARAMANFGFAHLTVAAPYVPHWREAKSAVGAPDVLQNAGLTDSLAAAVEQCTFVIGTGTLTHRKPEQPVIPLPELGPLIERELARGGRAALIFGPEKHGLTRDDLAFCHVLVEIPTDPLQPSMNLGQAVAVCLYELACRPAAPIAQPTIGKGDEPAVLQDPAVSQDQAPAVSEDLERLATLIEDTMIAAQYSPSAMRDANRYDLRLMLRRLSLSAHDVRRILGLFRRVLWRIGSPIAPPRPPSSES
jgi:TrmH family RNA methyltransferase